MISVKAHLPSTKDPTRRANPRALHLQQRTSRRNDADTRGSERWDDHGSMRFFAFLPISRPAKLLARRKHHMARGLLNGCRGLNARRTEKNSLLLF